MRFALKLIQTCAAAAVLTFWVLALRPQTLGGPAAYLVVRGDSMLPTYETGDLLVLRRSGGYVVGDVVAYQVPDGELGEGHVVVHRIVGGDATSGWVMEGDNNPAPDPWTPRDADIVGTPWVALPQAGRFVSWLHQPIILAGLAAAVVVALVISRPPSRSRLPVLGPNPEPTG
jgi:signal peptidase I